MEKLILKDGTIFDALPLGIVSNDVTKRRRLIFKSELDYNTVLSILSNTDNVSQITYTLENGTVIAVYQDCVSLKSLTKDFDNGTYVAEFGTDATERIVQELQAKVEQMQRTIDEFKGAKEDENEPSDDETEGVV